MAIDVSKLPISFVTRTGKQASDKLPLPFTRRVGDDPGTKPQPKWVKISGCAVVTTAPTLDVTTCLEQRRHVTPVVACLAANHTPVVDVVRCLTFAVAGLPSLTACTQAATTPTYRIATCLPVTLNAYPRMGNCALPTVGTAPPLANCASAMQPGNPLLQGCKTPRVTIAPQLVNCHRQHGWGLPLAHCHSLRYQRAVRPPCEYYPIPLPPPPPDVSPCRVRPPSHRLPLPFTRRRVNRDPSRLPLPLRCWHDSDTTDLPTLPGYIMHNRISAEFNGQTLQILALTLKADTDGYCWQGDLTLAPADFAKLQMDTRKAGDEAVITLRINHQRWDILAEDYRDTRRFIGYSYTVTGRSITAKLGADYTQGRHIKYEQSRYARQIADEQLQPTPYTIAGWDAVDWLVPGDNYTVSGQTPIAVVMDIAQAIGAFVESHPYEPQLFVRPVWAKAAWEKPTPALTIPSNLILSISGQRRISERCNGVRVVGKGATAKGALVWREGTDQTPEAALREHALYTDETAHRAAGIHALSETGTHKIETVTLPWAEKYQLPLASLGAVWAFTENGSTWQGVIKGIQVEVTLDNNAPVVTQTLTIDRYMGD